MPVVEAVESKMPSSFSKGSGQYVELKQKMSDTDFDVETLKVTCADADEKRKTLIAVKAYLKKKGLAPKVVARTENLEIWIGIPS